MIFPAPPPPPLEAGNGTLGHKLKGWMVAQAEENAWYPQRGLVPTSQSGAEFWAVWWGSWPPLEPLSFLLTDVADLPRV